MKIKSMALALGAAGAFNGIFDGNFSIPTSVQELMEAQNRMLKVNWGKPGFCSEFDSDYDPKMDRCGSRGHPLRHELRKKGVAK